MSWDWERIAEDFADPRVERQMHEYGCGAACAVMLLRDRGIQADQLVLAAGLRLPSTAKELAERLNQFSRGRHSWAGGHLDLDAPPSAVLLRHLCNHGSWAALLIPEGRNDGHWVVVDGFVAQQLRIRDPSGSSYRISYLEFVGLMRFSVVVFERGAFR